MEHITALLSNPEIGNSILGCLILLWGGKNTPRGLRFLKNKLVNPPYDANSIAIADAMKQVKELKEEVKGIRENNLSERTVKNND